MTLHIALLLAIIAVGLALFTLERFPPDVVALGILLTLVLGGLLPPELALAGFTSDAVIMTFGLLVFSAALMRTGVIDAAGGLVLRLTRGRPARLPAAISLAAVTLSAFISNTATTAMFVPLSLALSRRERVRASTLLMPLAFSAILASSVTLISSSTNLVISGVMSGHGLPPLGVFELTAVGLPIVAVGLIYLSLLGHRLIPDRGPADETCASHKMRPYLAEVVLLPGSPLVGKTLEASRLGRDMDVTVLRVLRNRNHHLAPRAHLQLAEGDELLIKGERDEVLKIRDRVGFSVKGEVASSDPRLQSGDSQMAEAILLPWSRVVGQTLEKLRFRERYGLQVLGISRRGRNLYRKLSHASLHTGDQLLVQGSPTSIARADRDKVLHILGSVGHEATNHRCASIAILIFLGVLAAIALGLLSVPAAVLLGILLVFVMRCIAPEEVYGTIEWRALAVIGSMLAVGRAMEHTGAAAYLAAQIATAASHTHPTVLLSAFFALALLLTQPMSNQAAAVVVVPVALQTATRLGLNPRTFAVMIAVGASCSFITPLEPACLMVYGPGHYRFTDFLRVGAGLTVLVYAIAILLVPLIWVP